jgi:hypothetical protein
MSRLRGFEGSNSTAIFEAVGELLLAPEAH